MLYNNSTIKAVLSKNDTDLIITMQSYKMEAYGQAALIQLYLYSPKLYYNFESWGNNVTDILSNDLGLTEDEINILANVDYKKVLNVSNLIAQIDEYDIWRTKADFLSALQPSTLYKSSYNRKKLKDLPVEELKLIAGDLQKSIAYKVYKSLPDNEKNLYSLHIAKSKLIDLKYREYRNKLASIEKILNILSNHVDNIIGISCDIDLTTTVEHTNIPTMTIKLNKKPTNNTLNITEMLLCEGKKYIANYISFNEISYDFDKLFKNIDESIYLTKILPLDKAFVKMEEQHKPVYEYELRQAVIDNVLKSVANKYLKSGNNIQLSEYEKEIINLSNSMDKPDLSKNTILDAGDYYTHCTYKESRPTLYPDKEVSNKDLLYLLTEIYAGLNKR